MTDLLSRLVPSQAGALWIGFLVAFVLLGNHDRLLSRRNLAILALLSIAPFLYDILDVGPGTQMWSFRAIFLLTGLAAIWGVRLSRGSSAPWRPNLPLGATKVIAISVVALTTATVLVEPPDDAGTYTNLGAQRWLETGQLPYGDELLKGPDAPGFGASATYGPVLFGLHVPFQLVLGQKGNAASDDPMDRAYQRPAPLASQLACLLSFLLGLGALFRIVRRSTDENMAWATVAVLAATPYYVGLGGEELVIGGLRYISHIAPAALTLVAFMLLHRPLWAGSVLALGAGALFYPAFFFPIWFCWYAFRRDGAARFAVGFGATGLLLAGLVFFFTDAGPGENAISLFLESTLEHQEGTGPLEYGLSSFSFWTHHPGLSAIFQRPLFGDSSLYKLSFLLFAGFCGFASMLAKDRSPAQLAALTAATAAAIQLWKTHATGSYVEWYLPFLLIAILTQGRDSQPPPESSSDPVTSLTP